MTKIAALQLTTIDNLDHNLIMLDRYITLAAQNGATHIFTPENSDIILPYMVAKNYDFNSSYITIVEILANLSRYLSVFIHVGSIKVPTPLLQPQLSTRRHILLHLFWSTLNNDIVGARNFYI